MPLVLGLLLIVVGLLLVAVALLSRGERLPMNHVIGYRLPVLFESRAKWNAGHRAAWIPTLLSGIAAFVGGIGCAVARSEGETMGFALGGVIGMGILIVIGSAMAMRGAQSAE